MSSENHRRTWNRSEYQSKAIERKQQNEVKDKAKNEDKKMKKNVLETNSVKIGRTFIKSSTAKKIFYCENCDVQSNDSMSYYSHMNSKLHHKNIGVNIRDVVSKRSSLNQVKEKFNQAKNNLRFKPYNVIHYNQVENNLEETKNEENCEIEDSEMKQMKELMGFSKFGKD